MKPEDKNSLTAVEYEEIYHVLTDYCLRAHGKLSEHPCMDEVRIARAAKIEPILRKMEARMKEFPPSTV